MKTCISFPYSVKIAIKNKLSIKQIYNLLCHLSHFFGLSNALFGLFSLFSQKIENLTY